MCSRFKLLYNIKTATIEEIIEYLVHLARLYIILCCVSIALIIVDAKRNKSPAWNIVSVILYIINLCALYRITCAAKPKSEQMFFLKGAATCLGVFDLVELVYNAHFHQYQYIYLIFPILMQVSTVYLAIELQLKIRENDNNDDKMVDAVPISSPSAPPPLVEVKVIPQTPRGQEEV